MLAVKFKSFKNAMVKVQEGLAGLYLYIPVDLIVCLPKKTLKRSKAILI